MQFKLNTHYKNDEISNAFGGSNVGGMRYHRNKVSGKEHMVLISKISHNTYSDKLTGNILHYTGTGKHGDQRMVGPNKRLLESMKRKFPVYLFLQLATNEYFYAGNVKVVTKPFHQRENNRRVIIFPIASITKYPNELPNLYHKLTDRQNINNVSKKLARNSKRVQRKNKRNTYRAVHSSTKQLERHVRKNEQKGTKLRNHKYQVTTSHYVRDPEVAELSRRYANYRCQLCQLKGKSGKTFLDNKTKHNYVESHHIQWLSHGGPDSIRNVIALCPTCHRMMHHAKGKDINNDVKLLKKQALKLAKKHGF